MDKDFSILNKVTCFPYDMFFHVIFLSWKKANFEHFLDNFSQEIGVRLCMAGEFDGAQWVHLLPQKGEG